MEFPWARASQTSVRGALSTWACLKAEVDWCLHWCFSSGVHNPYRGCERLKGSSGVLQKKTKIYVNGKGKVMLKKRGALCSLKRYKILQLKGFSFLKYLILKCYSQIQPSRADQPKTRSDFQKGREIAAYISFSLPALCFYNFLQCS